MEIVSARIALQEQVIEELQAEVARMSEARDE